MIKIINKITLGLIVSTILLSGCSKNEDFSNQKELKLLIIGDSLSSAYEIPKDKSWPELIQKKFDENYINVKVVNHSKSGDRTVEALKNQNKHIAENPDIVVINIGANDALKKTPVAQTIENYEELLDGLKNSTNKPEFLLVNIRPPKAISFIAPHSKEYLEIIPDIARTNNLTYVPDFFNGLDNSMINNKHFLSDKLHPNDKAQPILMNTIYDAVLPLIKKKYQ